MRIAIDASRLAVQQRTGTEAYTYELVRALAQTDRTNQYCLYVNQIPSGLPPLGRNWQIKSIPLPRLWTHMRLGPAWQRDRPDVAFVPAHVLPMLPPRRSVVTIHDLGYEHYPEAHPTRQRLYLRYSTLWSARMATQIIADSAATKRDLLHYTGIAAEKVTVVYLAVHERFYPRSADQINAVATKYGLPNEYLLFVSTIQPRKNLVRLIEAYAQARQQCPDLPILALGGKKGWLTEQIAQQAQQLGISEHVAFLGYVDDADLPALLSGASIYLLPSLYEGFGMTVLEAMASGVPVITSNVSSLPEVAGEAAVLVDPTQTPAIAQAIVALWQNPQQRQQLRERGLEWAKGWTWQRSAEQTLAVLTDVGQHGE